MKKGHLINGKPFLEIKIEHFVTKMVFAKAIAGYHHHNHSPFNDKMTKTQAIKILKKGLYHEGNDGIYTDHWDGASEEFLFYFNTAYDKAKKWIDKNYPYLNQ